MWHLQCFQIPAGHCADVLILGRGPLCMCWFEDVVVPGLPYQDDATCRVGRCGGFGCGGLGVGGYCNDVCLEVLPKIGHVGRLGAFRWGGGVMNEGHLEVLEDGGDGGAIDTGASVQSIPLGTNTVSRAVAQSNAKQRQVRLHKQARELASKQTFF